MEGNNESGNRISQQNHCRQKTKQTEINKQTKKKYALTPFLTLLSARYCSQNTDRLQSITQQQVPLLTRTPSCIMNITRT